MKKLIIAGMLSLFAFTSAAYACDGMKGQHDSQTQAAKDKAKSEKAKKESGSETTKS